MVVGKINVFEIFFYISGTNTLNKIGTMENFDLRSREKGEGGHRDSEYCWFLFPQAMLISLTMSGILVQYPIFINVGVINAPFAL